MKLVFEIILLVLAGISALSFIWDIIRLFLRKYHSVLRYKILLDILYEGLLGAAFVLIYYWIH